jgi:acyl carrier protein
MREMYEALTPEELALMVGRFLMDLRKGTSADPIVIMPDTDLLVDVGIDSLEMTEMVYWLEDATGAKLDLDRLELRHFSCVAELARFVNDSRT